MDEDQKIILSVLDGYINNYEKLVRKYQNLIYTIAHSIVKDESISCNIVQDSFVKAYEYLKKRKIDNFKSFVCKLATNKSIDFVKHRATAFEKEQCLSLISLNTVQSVEESYIEKEKKHILKESIDKLAPNYKDVILSYYFENLSYAQIALKMNIPIKTVETRLYRAKRKLKKILKEEKI